MKKIQKKEKKINMMAQILQQVTGISKVCGSNPSGDKNLFSLIHNLFISHRFNSWMPDLLLNEDLDDLEDIIQEG